MSTCSSDGRSPIATCSSAPRGSDGWAAAAGQNQPSASASCGQRQRGTEHHRIGATGDGLGQVAGRVDVAVGQHVHVAAAGLVEVFAPRRGGVGDRGRHRHADAEHLVTGGHATGGAVADDHPGRTGAHQVQRGAVVQHAAGDDRHIELGDERLEVQRFAVLATRSADTIVP